MLLSKPPENDDFDEFEEEDEDEVTTLRGRIDDLEAEVEELKEQVGNRGGCLVLIGFLGLAAYLLSR